jgi:large subunit ribosomal protein L21
VDFREAETGATITFDKVLLLSGEGVKLGEPVVAGASVTAEVMGPELGEKLVIQKFRRRKNYRRKTGHRQLYTRVRITGIKG